MNSLVMKSRILMAACLAFILNSVSIKAQTYASLPFTETFENAWINKDGTRDVPSVYWKNTPATGVNSWSRDDDGIARGAWTGTNFYPNTPAAANSSSHSASFNSYEASLSGTLDLYVNFSTLAGSKALYFWYINSSGDDKLEVSVSTDGGTTFGTPLITLYNKSGWTKICLDLGNLTSSTGVIRFKGIHVLSLNSPISIDDVFVGSHSTTPIVADFSADRVSGIAPLTVNFTDKSTGDVTKWDWDFNNDGTIDATTPNASYVFYSAGTFTVKLTSSKPGVSNSKTITVTTTPQAFASLPFIEDFEHVWVNREGTRDVPSLSFKNNPCTGNNSWRRNDDQSSANWVGIVPSVDYSPSGAMGSQYSARFHSAGTNQSGALEAFIDFSTQTGNKTLSFWYINPTGSDKLEVYLSTDGGVTFGSVLKTVTVQKIWEKVIIDLGNITSSTGVIRFKTIVDYDDRNNGLDMGIDDIRVSNPTQIPIDAYFTSDKTSGSSPLTVNFTDKSGGTPTSWQWDFTNDGVTDATTQNPSYTYSAPGIYSVKLIVQNSGYSGEITRTNYIVVPGYTGLPYYQTFESDWVNRDNVRDVPDNFWKGNPATGNNSWSREDDGIFRGAWSGSYGKYSPGGANGSIHSACFDTYNVYNGTGSMDLFVNFASQAGEKRLTFWYINRGGNDKLEVFLSVGGGATFGTAITTLGVSGIWSKINVNLGNLTSATGVLRFKATTINSDPTSTNIGIDDVSVVVPALLPLNAEFTQNVISGSAPLAVNFVDQSEGAPTSWQWDFNNDGTVDATTQNPSYTYSATGVYSVKLTASKGGTDNVELKTKHILVTGYASLPFSENFENPWLNRDGYKDTPSAFAKNTPFTGNDSWSRDDEGISRGAWGYSGYGYSPAGANNTSHSARFHSGGTPGIGILDFYLNFSTMTGDKELRFWYINASGTDKLEVFLSTDGGTTFGTALKTLTTASAWTKVVLSLGTSASANCVLRFKATSDYGLSDIGLDEIRINMVEAGFSAGILSGATPLTVSFTDQSAGTPTSWKWDFNNDGVVDATTQNPVYTYTSSGKYSVKLIVLKTGSSDTLVKKDYINVRPIQYASLPFFDGFENSWVNLDQTRDVPGVNWSNTPATGNNSWSRDDDGVARGSWSSLNGSYTPIGANGSAHSARFHSNNTGLSGSLDLYLNFSTLVGDKSLSFWYVNTNGTDGLEILLSTNGGTTFTSLSTLGIKSAWSKITVPLGNSISSACVVRFKATGDVGMSDIGLDEIKINPVEAAFTANVVSGGLPMTVSFIDQSTGTPTGWEWDFNNDGVVDATTQNPVYTYTTAGKYTVKLKVLTATSSDILIKTEYITLRPVYYAALPFNENFENPWVNLDQTRDVPSNSWINSPATGNNSWSRDDDGVARAAWPYPYGTYSPAGANGTSHSARMHTYNTYLSNNFDLLVDFSTLSGDKALYFWYINTNGADKLEVLLSNDGGASFTSLTTLGTKSTWSKIALDLGNTNSANGIIRFKATGDYGSSDIGMDEVFVGKPSTTPIVTTFKASATSGMAPVKINFTDQSTGDVTAWKWDFNGDGAIESTIQNPAYTFSAPGTYSVKLVSSKSGMKDSLVKADLITVIPQVYAALPFKEDFDEPWVNRDFMRDVPSNYYISNPSTGNNSWSRYDDTYRAWSSYRNSSYSPSGALGTPYSARFNSYGSNSLSGTLDLFVDFTTQFGVQQLSFWYINTSGTDKLEVYLSRDGGTTFDSPLQTLTTAANWTKVTIDLGFIYVSKGVIRFKATGDGSTSDIGIDQIVVCDPSSTPVEANFSSNVTTGSRPLSVNFTDQSIGTPSFWKWDFDNDGTADATTQNPTYTYTSPGIYSVKLITGDDNLKDSITKANYIVVPGYASLPFSENFENNWSNRDGIRDVASYYFKNTPATGENSWSRSDDGVLRLAWGYLYGQYYPSGVNNSAYSARFHSWSTFSIGNMDLYVDFSTLTGSKTLSFWYINPSGSDSLNVYLSTDGGATEGTLITTKKVASSWTKLTVDLGNVTTPTGVIRFKAVGDNGNSDLGIDDILIGTMGVTAIDANFAANATQGLAPLTVKFTDQSTGSPTSWKWDFNSDGRVDSVTQNPSYTYTSAGKYSVKLEALGSGSTDKETKVDYISVYNKVKADFTSDKTDGFAPLVVNFTDKSTGEPTTWKWDFNNDGTTDATTQNTFYTFTEPGSYSVKLIISNPASKDTINRSLLIHVNGKASLPYFENFDDTWKSFRDTRDIPSYNWGNAPAGAMYSWSRDDDGVARGAWNSNGGSYTPAGADGSAHSARFHTYDFMDSYLSSFYLNVDFSSLAGNKTLSFYYINPGGTDKLDIYLSTDGGSTFGSAIATQTTSSAWTKVTVDLGNVTSAKGVLLFDVAADLDDTDLGIDELAIQSTGVTPVSAQFTSNVTSGIVPLTVKFTDQSTGSPTSWKWDFNNDGIIDSTTQNPSFIFTKTGTYSVRLVTSKPGTIDSETKLGYITVEDPVDAKFTADKTSGIGALTVSFTDQSTGNPTSWNWDFNNDGTVDATTKNPAYTFTTAGNYTVKLVVSKTNSSDTEIKTYYIVVSAPVVADFKASSTVGIVPVTVNFTDQSTGSPVSWNWDFNNDGTVDASTQNPSYTFTNTGTYTISLTSSKPGSTNTKTRTGYITVIDPINADFIADKTNGPAPLTVRFTDQSAGTPASWSWDFNNDGIQDSITQNPSYTFTTSGTYTVKLMVSKLGFGDSEVKTGYIVVSPSTGTNVLNLPEREITIYPSPATTWVKMKLENFENDKVTLEVIDLQGTVILTSDLTGQKSHEFDFSTYARGVYYLKAYCKDKVYINKLILQ